MFRLAHSLLAAGLLTGLALNAQAQTTPADTKKLQPDHYYLNGQPATKAEIKALEKKKAIKRMDVLTGQQAVDYTHDPASKMAALITTK